VASSTPAVVKRPLPPPKPPAKPTSKPPADPGYGIDNP
jgi:hypothetical protein